MTSSNGNIFRVTGPLCGEFTGHRWIPLTGQWRGALMFSLIYAWINGWSKQSLGWWLETPSRSLWGHCNVRRLKVRINVMYVPIWHSYGSVHGDAGVLLPGLAISSLQWRHNWRDGISNHQPRDCLLNRLFGRKSKKHQSSASLAFVRGIHRGPVNSPHEWPVTRKIFPFNDGIMW